MADINQFDVDDIESFIKGLKDTFDTLDESDPNDTQGLQLQLAKAISLLRHKKVYLIEQTPKFTPAMPSSKEELKEILLDELEFLKKHLDSDEVKSMKKFNLALKIAKLRERISHL